ncbi:MAG TPA: hemolysin family protein [Acidimicrobiia bacterium]
MNTADTIYVLILATCALASGFFSGSETALIGIGKERVHQLAETSRRGRRVQQLVSDPDRLLSTLLVANNLVNILGAAVATTLFIDLLGQRWGPWLATLVVTAVILVVGEITPKTLAARYPEAFSLAVAPLVFQLSRVLAPIARLFTSITRILFRMFRVPARVELSAVTEEDIRALAALGHAGGEIEEVEREIIDALFGLADRPVREVMTPRVDIETLALPVTVEAVRKAVAETGHSRYPVAERELDSLRGVLYVKDVLQLADDATPAAIERLIRTPHAVPESAPILQVLQDLRRRRFAFAVVVDEHGGIEGIVTIKDLVSELVGELQDEYDPGIPSVVKIGADQWLADGRLPIEDLEDALGCRLPEGPYTTAGGLIMSLAGRIPDEGDFVVADGHRFTVLSMERNRIDRIRVEPVA